MHIARMLAALACLVAGSGAVLPPSAAAYEAERGSRLLRQDIEVPGPRRTGPVKLRELVGAPLVNRLGDRVGRIEDVVVDVGAQRVDYAVVQFDKGWLGTSKRTAVPLLALSGRSTGAAGWVLDADPAVAIALPEFQPAKLQRINDDDVVAEVHQAIERSPWVQPARTLPDR